MNLISKNLSQLRRIALAVLLASFAILDTPSISAQEPGRTITSPFGVANPYMNASDASESGTDGDTFVDPETGEVGHIIRNPFGVANPEGVDTGIDIPDNGEEVGGVITNPFGTPNPNGVDTGVDVLDEDEEYLISLPDEETDVDEREPVEDEGNADDTLDDAKDIEEESYEATTEKYVPVIDNPIRGGEYPSFNFKLEASAGGMTVSNETGSNPPIIYVSAGDSIHMQAILTNGSWPSGSPTWTLLPHNGNQTLDIILPPNANGNANLPLITVPNEISFRRYTVTATAGDESRSIQITICKLDLQIDSNNDGVITLDDDIIEDSNASGFLGKIIMVNDGDYDQDGIPDCYDGFDIDANEVSQAGNLCSFPFAHINVDISNIAGIIQNRNAALISFIYWDADPNRDVIGGTGTYDDPYCFSDYNRGVRIWTKDGTSQRNKNSILHGGDYVPNGVPIPLSVFGEGNIIHLFIEAKSGNIDTETYFNKRVQCSIKINGITQVFSDVVQFSSFESFIKAIDISGYTMDDNLRITRISPTEEVDGIATDHLNGVPDGAALLLCFAVPQKLIGRIDSETIRFSVRECNNGEGSNGSICTVPINNTVLSNLLEDGKVPDGRKVIKQVIYLPPIEMNSGDSQNEFFRNTELVAKVKLTSNSNVEFISHKRLIITRPPLLMIHGINGTSKSVFDDSGFSDAMNAAGIMAYGVDHNNDMIDSFSIGEYSNIPSYFGNGDIVKSYQFLRDRISTNPSLLNSSPGDPESYYIEAVLPKYRAGLVIQGKKIAIQKVDVVAYSYGGLLARWYVEKAPEYETRRDVRKIITIGTPHRGSPITNMMCETYKNSLFANALPGESFPLGLSCPLSLKYISGCLDFFNMVKWAKLVDPVYDDPNPLYQIVCDYLSDSMLGERLINNINTIIAELSVPGTEDAIDDNLYEALHVIAHGSERIEELNGEEQDPLQSDVAYASIVGTNSSLSESYLIHYIFDITGPEHPSSWRIFNPKYLTNSSARYIDKSYFPWLEYLEEESDGIVPEDSQMLVKDGVPPDEYANIVFKVEKSHLGEVESDFTQRKVISWIKSPDLWKGSALREHFLELSEHYNEIHENIFSAQWKDAAGKYHDTGVNHESIAQVQLRMPEDDYDWDRPLDSTIPMLGPHGGLVEVICTGMVKSNSSIYIFADGHDDDNNNDYVLYNDCIEGPSPLIKLKPFRITGKIGRSYNNNFVNEIRGPYGFVPLSDPTEPLNIVYRINGPSLDDSFYQSPPAQIALSLAAPLDPIDGPSSFLCSETYTARGGFHVSSEALNSTNRTQELLIEILDNDESLYIPLEPDLLFSTYHCVPLDSDAFPGILMPYAMQFSLFKNDSGYVSGAQGSSEEVTAEIYQKLFELIGLPDPESGTRSITATNSNP